MAEDKQEKEFSVYGFNTGAMRRGVIIFIIAIFLGAIIALYRQNLGQQKKIDNHASEMTKMQAEMYEKIIKEVRSQVSPAVDRVTEAAIKVDSAAASVEKAQAEQNVNNKKRR